MLKTTTLFAGAMLLSSIGFAQNERTLPNSGPVFQKNLNSAAQRMISSCADTLHLDVFTADTLTYYSYQQGSYVSGTNHYGDVAKAELFQNTGAATITDAIFYFAVASPTNSTAPVGFTVWAADGADGAPNTIITSKSVSLGEIATEVAAGNNYYTVTFDEPAQVTGNYFIGVQLPTAGNLAIVTTQFDEAPAGSQGWENWSTGEWYPYDSVFADDPTISHVILPVTSPVAARFTMPSSLDLANGNSVTFTNTSFGGTINNWAFQGGNIASSTDQNPTVTFNTAGSYIITLTHEDASGCSETYSQTLSVTGMVGISEELAKAVKVYPNPATSRINVEMPGLEAKNIVVTNAIGQVVKQQNVTATDVNFVDVANLSAGMYYVQIVTEAGSVTKKVSVQK